MANAGFIVVFMKKVEAPPDPEDVKALVKHIEMEGGEMVFMGAVLKAYETAVGCPPNAAVVKFESKQKAVDMFEGAPYQALLDKLGIGKTIFRDVRIIEAPADTFVTGQGKAYWIAQLENIVDKDKFAKYFAGFMAANEKGFEISLDDGTTTKANLTIKAVAGSTYYEEAKKLVPNGGEGADFFPGANTESGLVVIAEMDTHEIGAKLKECTDYRNAFLAALDQTYSDEASFAVSEKEFTETVFKRDVRIIGV